jgi:hypothetical protein
MPSPSAVRGGTPYPDDPFELYVSRSEAAIAQFDRSMLTYAQRMPRHPTPGEGPRSGPGLGPADPWRSMPGRPEAPAGP